MVIFGERHFKFNTTNFVKKKKQLFERVKRWERFASSTSQFKAMS